jgi:glutamine cyclotransferase
MLKISVSSMLRPSAHFPCIAFISALALFALAGCKAAAPAPANTSATPVSTEPVFYTYEVVNVFPHDRNAFTEGLVFINNRLFESTGLNDHSTLREVDLKTGAVLRQVVMPSEYFGEGLAILGDKAYQLTWQNHKGFVYDLETFKIEKEFTYTGEGWGLTTDGHALIMSDGTSQIRFLDPATFAVQRTINVQIRGEPLNNLNELEYIHGEIYANVWQTFSVVRIDPATGHVVGVIDFTGLLPAQDRAANTDVLNGIAYDAVNDRLFITGKNWPKLFEVRLKPMPAK